jgi:cell division protein YceG involved in septum cleavage
LFSAKHLIAGVFLNRLEMERMLQADLTVQYALGQQPDED